MDQYTLLQQKVIQDLLQLSEKQRKAVAEIDAVGEFHGSGPDWERRRLQLAQEQERQVEQMLGPDKLRRFRQIALQSLGPAAFREPEVITALKLTTAQGERIRAIEANTVSTWAVHVFHHHSGPMSSESPQKGQFESGSPRSELPRKSYDELRTSALAQIQQEVLTREQVQRWKELTGEPVDGKIFASVRKFFTQGFGQLRGE